MALTYIYISKNKKRLSRYHGISRFISTIKKDMLMTSKKYNSLHYKVRERYNGNFKAHENFLDILPT